MAVPRVLAAAQAIPKGGCFAECDPRLIPLVELASSYGMALVVGAPVWIEATLYIGALLISAPTESCRPRGHSRASVNVEGSEFGV